MRILSLISAFALLAIIGVCLVFLFPASCGPFSVTHGPATAFRALEAASALFAAMSTALLMALLRCMFYLQSIVQPAGRIQRPSARFALRC